VWLQQLVIPPLLGGSGNRCSVKPASRSAPLSLSDDTYAFAKSPSNTQLSTWNGQATLQQPQLQPGSQRTVPSPLCPYLGYKL